MTTNNRTNEQIVAEAICGRRYRSGTPGYLASTDNPTDYGDARSVLTALEAAGRLAGEPTEAQVEAAAKAIADCHNPGMFEKYPENWRVEARAALVAAASAAPVAPQVSESGALTLVEEVIAIHADRIDTHYGDCYKYHVACLAAEVKHRLAGKEKNDD